MCSCSLTEIYRGCFDGWLSTELSHDYRGCRQQPYLGKTVEWCLCDEEYWFVTFFPIHSSFVTLALIRCNTHGHTHPCMYARMHTRTHAPKKHARTFVTLAFLRCNMDTHMYARTHARTHARRHARTYAHTNIRLIYAYGQYVEGVTNTTNTCT